MWPPPDFPNPNNCKSTDQCAKGPLWLGALENLDGKTSIVLILMMWCSSVLLTFATLTCSRLTLVTKKLEWPSYCWQYITLAVLQRFVYHHQIGQRPRRPGGRFYLWWRRQASVAKFKTPLSFAYGSCSWIPTIRWTLIGNNLECKI